MDEDRLARFREAAERTAEEQRRIQEAVDRRDRDREESGGGGDGEAVTAGGRDRPGNPLPEQHPEKPGEEHELEPRPQFQAPTYRASGRLEGKRALVTGGDSGIGRSVSVLFAREGADVAVVYLSEHQDARETAEAVEAEGRRCLLVSGDVRDPEFCAAAVEHVVEEFGGLDVLVNNAAFQEHVGSLEELSDEHLDMTVRTNVYGYVQMARAALPHLGQGDSVINTGSETGFFGNPGLLDYSATKGAIHAFTRALATNVVSQGIRVNGVAPGPVWTPLNPADKPPDAVEGFGSSTPMNRPAQPDELAPTYVYLADAASSGYVTGAVIPVMGGPTGGA